MSQFGTPNFFKNPYPAGDIKAVENSERAGSAKRAADRDFYLRTERKWLGLAEGLRWIADLERRHG